jgi:hypothetical protein
MVGIGSKRVSLVYGVAMAVGEVSLLNPPVYQERMTMFVLVHAFSLSIR